MPRLAAKPIINTLLVVPDSPNEDTITGHATLGLPRGVLLRLAASAFQAECRGFETRLPLQTPCHAQRDTQPSHAVVREDRKGQLQRSGGDLAQPLIGCGGSTRTYLRGSGVGTPLASCRLQHRAFRPTLDRIVPP